MRLVALCAVLLGACVVDGGAPEHVRWLDAGRFAREVQPVLAERCGNPSCHGRPERPLSLYSAGQWRADPTRTHMDEPLTADELEHNYTMACVFATGAARPEQAELVVEPLADWAGVHHGGGVVFEGRDDRGYRTVLEWLEEGWEP